MIATFLVVHTRLLTRCKVRFTLSLFSNYFFSKITWPFPQKSYESALTLTETETETETETVNESFAFSPG